VGRCGAGRRRPDPCRSRGTYESSVSSVVSLSLSSFSFFSFSFFSSYHRPRLREVLPLPAQDLPPAQPALLGFCCHRRASASSNSPSLVRRLVPPKNRCARGRDCGPNGQGWRGGGEGGEREEREGGNRGSDRRVPQHWSEERNTERNTASIHFSFSFSFSLCFSFSFSFAVVTAEHCPNLFSSHL